MLYPAASMVRQKWFLGGILSSAQVQDSRCWVTCMLQHGRPSCPCRGRHHQTLQALPFALALDIGAVQHWHCCCALAG